MHKIHNVLLGELGFPLRKIQNEKKNKLDIHHFLLLVPRQFSLTGGTIMYAMPRSPHSTPKKQKKNSLSLSIYNSLSSECNLMSAPTSFAPPIAFDPKPSAIRSSPEKRRIRQNPFYKFALCVPVYIECCTVHKCTTSTCHTDWFTII